ncbi:MAG: GTP-binding protein, partial [Candidatus Aenigmarchaeota archaeon]|nr:GTP-binding protein [Candidatus Aenigmarchaeota archaeon]MDI6722193.1 GTP-binding protein [Candidatus Aenigmarchaeota archaeon]
KEVYRLKGFVVFDEGSFIFNYVAGRYDLEEFSVEKTKLVFIGSNVKRHESRIKEMIKSCEL